ncbi:amidohydrolase family protein [Anaerobacillus sp. HL2]|nr:amidohydrolase family protein [Anaerobacillus sp. HL2]
MRMAALIHKGYNQDPTVITSETALQMATWNGSKALALNNIGLIEKERMLILLSLIVMTALAAK